jgi:catechol 2,3-dioxygenase-like lactoylglutathione lyase family enzyme
LAALLFCGGVDAAGVIRIERLTLTVADLPRSETFYTRAFGFRRVADLHYTDAAHARLLGVEGARIHALRLRLGDDEIEIEIDQYVSAVAGTGRPYPADSRSPDRWFQHFAIVVSDMDAAYRQLRKLPFKSISRRGPQALPGGVRAFKFRDPDGHPLELLQFPDGQGRSRWQDPAILAQGPFLGIDHTAIGIAATRASLQFYEQQLGMTQAYASINEGPTQQALDDSFNATVRITGLRPASAAGPGVELLDYRAPSIGRPAVADRSSSDIATVIPVFVVDDLDALGQQLFDAGVRFVSPRQPVELPPDLPGEAQHQALIVLDPDAHAVELLQ